MSKSESIEMEGVVTEVLTGGMFRVAVAARDGGDPAQGKGKGEKEGVHEHEVLAHLSGKMRKFRIRIVLGDRVVVEVSPYDLTRGRVTYRHK